MRPRPKTTKSSNMGHHLCISPMIRLCFLVEDNFSSNLCLCKEKTAQALFFTNCQMRPMPKTETSQSKSEISPSQYRKQFKTRLKSYTPNLDVLHLFSSVVYPCYSCSICIISASLVRRERSPKSRSLITIMESRGSSSSLLCNKHVSGDFSAKSSFPLNMLTIKCWDQIFSNSDPVTQFI